MLSGLLLLSLVIQVSWCYPSDAEVRLPDVAPTSPQATKNLSQASEGQKRPRSIDKSETAVNNLEKTIAEVEELIKSNPGYPKLTRGEILDLIENLTSSDPALAKKFGNVRENGKRALMVVMPFTPDGKNEMADIFTKPPVTHIIGTTSSTTAPPKKEHIKKKKPFADVENIPLADLFPNIQTNSPLEDAIPVVKPLPPPNKPLRRRRPELTTPALFTTSTTTKPTTERRTQMRRRTTTPVPQYPNHKYPEEERRTTEESKFVPNSGLTVINAPNLAVEANNVVKKPSTRKPSHKRRTTQKPFIEVINVPGDLKNVIKDLELSEAINSEKYFTEQAKTKSTTPSTTTTVTTSTVIPDVSNVADTLTPEMRELLMSFGLIPNPNEPSPPLKESIPLEPEVPEVSSDSYAGFKPMPDNAPSRDDMEALLASFGLGRNARKQKTSTPAPNGDGYNLDMIPESFKGVVENIGLKEKQSRKLRTSTVQKVQDKHVFNPEETAYASEDELKKLNKLLDMIKLLEKLNSTDSVEEMKGIDMESLKELVGSLNNDKFVALDEQGAPDPLNYDNGLIKNEVKRQESTTPKAATEDKPSVADLEDSFGGSNAETTTSRPAPKHNGFYYLVDWNTFLDIDNQKGKRVNLRFQPKVGDPKRFLSVSVP